MRNDPFLSLEVGHLFFKIYLRKNGDGDGRGWNIGVYHYYLYENDMHHIKRIIDTFKFRFIVCIDDNYGVKGITEYKTPFTNLQTF